MHTGKSPATRSWPRLDSPLQEDPPPYSTVLSTSSSQKMGKLKDSEVVHVVAVMGPTGSGKSTLIAKLAGKVEVKVGHSLKSCMYYQLI